MQKVYLVLLVIIRLIIIIIYVLPPSSESMLQQRLFSCPSVDKTLKSLLALIDYPSKSLVCAIILYIPNLYFPKFHTKKQTPEMIVWRISISPSLSSYIKTTSTTYVQKARSSRWLLIASPFSLAAMPSCLRHQRLRCRCGDAHRGLCGPSRLRPPRCRTRPLGSTRGR